MKRFLTTGFFGAILGIVIGGAPADASLISRGFLDEVLTDYATTTALDLKANKADLTDLSDKIGNDWPYNSDIMPEIYNVVSEFYPMEINLKNTSDLAHFLFGGALESGLYANAPGVLNFLGEKIINLGDHDIFSNKMLDGFRSLTQLTNGWKDTDGTTYLGVKDLNTKIGTLPTELNLYTREFAYMFNDIKNIELPADYPLSQFIIDMLFGNVINGGHMPGLQDIIRIIMSGGILNESWGGYMYMGLPDLSRTLGGSYLVENEGYVLNRTEFPFSKELFPDLEPQKVQFRTSIIEYLEQDLLDIRSPTLAGVTNKLLNGWTDENGVLANPGLKGIFEGWVGRNGQYTLGLQELELDSFYTYNPENDSPQLLKGLKGGLLNVLSSLLHNYGYSVNGGVLAPFWKLTQSAYKTDELSAKIGTLPSGNFPGFPGQESLFPWINQPLTYPTSLAELINAIYGNSETGAPGLLIAIIAGFPMDTDGDGQLDFDVGIRSNFLHARDANNLAKANATKIGTVPDGKNLAGMISETDAKIGTVPDGYETVGAALTAMDAKIDARELPSTSADGQYVLSAKKVGETISYTWVKMDLTNEEQSQ